MVVAYGLDAAIDRLKRSQFLKYRHLDGRTSEGNAEDRRQKKGTPNKISSALKEAILEAAEKAGGEDGIVGYLEAQALANPSAFMSLLGKVLPMTIADTGQNEETKIVVTSRVVWPEDKDGNIIWPEWAKDKSGRAQPINGVSPV